MILLHWISTSKRIIHSPLQLQCSSADGPSIMPPANPSCLWSVAATFGSAGRLVNPTMPPANPSCFYLVAATFGRAERASPGTNSPAAFGFLGEKIVPRGGGAGGGACVCVGVDKKSSKKEKGNSDVR